MFQVFLRPGEREERGGRGKEEEVHRKLWGLQRSWESQESSVKTNHNFAASETLTKLWDTNLSRKTRIDMYMSFMPYPGTYVKKSEPNERGSITCTDAKQKGKGPWFEFQAKHQTLSQE